MRPSELREWGRLRRHRRLRKKIVGTPERPRLVLHRSHMHLSAQLIDDTVGKTLLAVSTLQKRMREQTPKGGPAERDIPGQKLRGGNVEAAKRMGQLLAQAAKEAGIRKVVFDRGGYRYFGRVKAVAEVAREQGLEF